MRFTVATSEGSSTGLTQMLPTRILGPGERVGISDVDEDNVAGDIIPTNNIFFTYGTSDYAAICDGTCSGSSVIDLVAHYGGETMPSYPSGVTFSPSGITGITSTTDETTSYHRVATSGQNPTFLRSDWSAGPKTRGAGGTGGAGGAGGAGGVAGSGGAGGTGSCPATQPLPGSVCATPLVQCVYGNVTCSCIFQWVCQ